MYVLRMFSFVWLLTVLYDKEVRTLIYHSVDSFHTYIYLMSYNQYRYNIKYTYIYTHMHTYCV